MAYHRQGMTLRRPPWPALLALGTLVSLAAHVGAHAVLTGPSVGRHVHHHAGGPTHWRACAAICGAVLVAALGAYLVESARRGRPVHPPVWLAALLPPAGFAVSNGFGARALLLGALLQLPVAVAFLALARALTGRAAALGRALRSLPRPHLAAEALPWRPTALVAAPAPARCSRSALERGPPLLHRA